MPNPSIPPIPDDPSSLQSWAEAQGVAAALQRSSRDPSLHLSGPYSYRLTYLPAFALGDILTRDPRELRLHGHFQGGSFAALQKEIRSWLFDLAHQRARAIAAEATRVKRWRQALEQAHWLPAPLPAVLEAVLRLHAELATRQMPTRAHGAESVAATLSVRPLGVRVTTGGTYPNWSACSAEVDLVGWPAPPSVRCNVHLPSAVCEHQLSALEAVLDHFLQPRRTAAVDPAWLAELQRPAWERFLDATAMSSASGEAEPKPAPECLLSWRVQRQHGDISLEVFQHKLTKARGWSKGTRVAPERGVHHLTAIATPADALALEMWAAALSAPRLSPANQRLIFRTLELLVGHPQVYLAEADGLVPLHLQQGSLALHVERTAAGDFVPTPRLAGSAELARRALPLLEGQRTTALVIDRAEGASAARGILVRADPRSVELLREVHRFAPQLPLAAAPQLMARLATVEDRLALELPPELEGERLEPDLQPVLRLRMDSPEALSGEAGGREALELEIVSRPLPGGPTQVPGEGPAELSRFIGERRLRVRRELGAEQAAAEALLGRLPLPATAEAPQRWERRLASLDDALDLVGFLQALPAEGPTAVRVEWLEAPVRLVREAQPSDLRLRVTDQHDWFGLEGEIEIDGQQVKLALLLEAVRRRARYVQVGPHRWMALSQKLREQLGSAADVVHHGRQGLEVSPVAAHALEDLLDRAGEAKLSVRWRSLVKRLNAARTRAFPVPKAITAELRPYQAEGFAWLMRLAECGMGAVLADDMGLGKTLQALALLEARATEGPALVVAPTSVCSNWQREAARFATELELTRYHGPADERWANLEDLQPREVVVTSYGLLVEDAERFQKVRWATLVLDEAQALKNATTRRARVVRDLQAQWAVALSGTPIENHVGELWSLFRVVAPGLLGSWEQFRGRFAMPIEKHKDPERRSALARVVRPFILRRTKGEVARELPSRTEVLLPVTLSRGERRLYDAARMAALARLDSDDGLGDDQRFRVLAALTRLRQLACHPRLMDPESSERSSKLERLLELVEELREEGHRALVFSQFTSHLALVREALDAKHIGYRYLDGSTPATQRDAEVDAFQRGEEDLFLISLKAGGTGLNLTGADYVIHLDPWWNPAVEDQATDRAHRIGQTKPVTVYRLVAQGTIEEAILALHADKRDLVAGLLEGTNRAGKLTTEQLVQLIRTGAAGADEETSDDALGDLGAAAKAVTRAHGRHLQLVVGGE